jgi:hypothetical protein
MRTQDNSQLIGYGIVALIAAIIIYNYWHWLVGALAIIGFMYAAKEFNRNRN